MTISKTVILTTTDNIKQQYGLPNQMYLYMHCVIMTNIIVVFNGKQVCCRNELEKSVAIGDFNRQLQIAAKIESTYISKIANTNIKIMKKSVHNSSRQPKIAKRHGLQNQK